MIDIHTHILPGVDDGPQELELSLAMARDSSQKGVRKIIATPHFIEGCYEPDKQQILKKTEALNKILAGEEIKITILPGMEIEINHEVPGWLKAGRLLTLGDQGKYMLLELPFHSLPEYTEEVFYQLQLQGIQPILAHPERNNVIANDLKILYGLIQKGIYTQINAGSFLGYFGKRVKKTAEKIIELRMAHIVASDAHCLHGERGISLPDAYDLLQNNWGKDTAKRLFCDNPEKIMTGGNLVFPEPREPFKKKQGIFSFFKRP